MSLFNPSRYICNCESKRPHSQEDVKANKTRKCDRRDCHRLQHVVCSNEQTQGSLRSDQWLCDHCWEEAAERDAIKKSQAEQRQRAQNQIDAARRKKRREQAAARKQKRDAEAAADAEGEQDERDVKKKKSRAAVQKTAHLEAQEAIAKERRRVEAAADAEREKDEQDEKQRQERAAAQKVRKADVEGEQQQPRRTVPRSVVKAALKTPKPLSEDPPPSPASPPPRPVVASPTPPARPAPPPTPPQRLTGQEIRASLIRKACCEVYWDYYCKLGPCDEATELCNELTRRETSGPVHEPPKEWLKLLQSQFEKLLEAARYENKVAILWKFKNPKGGVYSRDRLVSGEVLFVINQGEYKFRRHELGLLLEVVGIAFKGQYWKPQPSQL